ncbi:hypothetical protein ABDK56_00200 [Sphingomonas sp. ASV193]|uniref:hypothetical protein n=1 Tax=Sphingomonas sp. ASV193 TaxID=3144405 RepID=UPI0032E8EBFD
MSVRVPRPLHGWRVFLGEVGIIVLGVLLALGAQQLVEDWHWRGDVAEFRASVRDEIEHDLWTYPFRAQQKGCIERRLDELQRWLDGWRGGRPARLTGPIGIPASLVIYTSAWDSRDAATLSHMPRAEVLGYGDLYSEFANSEVHRLDERAAWIELASFDGVTELTHEDQMKLQGLISRARLRDMRIDSNYARFAKRAARIGLHPVAIDDTAPIDPAICKAVLRR